MARIIGPPYPPLPYMLYQVLKSLCKKRDTAKERENLEKKMKTIMELYDEGLISEEECKKAIEKVLDKYSECQYAE